MNTTTTTRSTEELSRQGKLTTEWSSPGQLEWLQRYNGAWGSINALSRAGWSFEMVDEEELCVRTLKGKGIDTQDYHWNLMEDEDWKNFRAFVKAMRQG